MTENLINAVKIVYCRQVLSCYLSINANNNKAYKGKIYSNVQDAVADIPDGSKILVGGFGNESLNSYQSIEFFNFLINRSMWYS